MKQSAIIRFLESGALGPGEVERRSTSLSELFLTEGEVYKLKRALSLPYVDFSTPDARRRTCEREVTLNRRTAPGLYLGVTAVTQEEDGLALNGDGPAVDHLVHMRRFDETMLFHHMAEDGRLTDRHITRLADQLARFHGALVPLSGFGGHDAMKRAIGNVVEAAEKQDVARLGRITALAREWRRLLGTCGPRLERRRHHGHVRQCHGDMHLANICLVEDTPTPFDCIEFNDDLACIDTAYDMAFPVMDLLAHGRPGLANLLMNRYLSVTQDYTALPLLPIFIAARALVRACVNAMEAETDACARYLDVAENALTPAAPRLIAVSGRSGTGKSTLARRLAPDIGGPAGAIWLRTDMIRKAMLGALPEERLDEEAYRPEVTAQTYRRMARTALRALKAGWPVIVDGVFLKPEERRHAEHMASFAGVPFQGLWLEAPVDLRAERADGRTEDSSDADARIARMQEEIETGDITWARLDTSTSLEDTVARANLLILPAASQSAMTIDDRGRA